MEMFQWNLSPDLSGSPAAELLSRCVSAGVLTLEELDSASAGISPAFSHLQKREQRVRTQRDLDQVQLQVALLQEEQQSADVSHSFHLSCRFHLVQMFSDHLQEILRDHRNLRQRLMRPLTRNNLPVPAHLHRSVVDSLNLMVNFIQSLEEKLDSVHNESSTGEHLVLMTSSLNHLLAQAAEIETLTNQLLRSKSPDLHQQL